MNRERTLLIVTALAEGSCILLFGIKIIQDLPLEHQGGNVWMFFVGGIFVFIGLLLSQSGQAYSWLDDKLTKVGNLLDINPWQVFLMFSSPILAILTTKAAGFETKMYSPIIAVASWLIGIAFAVYGGRSRKDNKFQISRSTVLGFICVVTLAFIIRGIGTDKIPILLTGDESLAGLNAADFANDRWNNIFITGWYSFPTLFPFIESLSIRLLGQTSEALRLPAALAGALTVGAVYIMGKEMFNPRVGIFAALFLSALHFHIHFSRLGLNNVWDGLWFTITITALWYGWKHESRSAYIIGGVALGFSQYFYLSSRALFGIILISIVLAGRYQNTKLKQSLPHFLVSFICAAIITAPLTWYYINRPNDFLAPYTRFSMLGEPGIFQNISVWKALPQTFLICIGAYTHTPLVHFWYAPGTPILRPIAVVLFYAGILFLFLSNRDSRLVLLLLWLLAFGVIASLSDYPPASQRYVASAPACALIVGYGLYRLGNVLEQFLPKFRAAATSLTFLTLAIAMISDLYFYFIENTFTERLNNINSNGILAQELGNYLADKPPKSTILFLGTPDSNYHSVSSTQYLAPQVTGIDVLTSWKTFDHANLESNKTIFIFTPERENEIKEIMKEYPGCQLKEKREWNNQLLFHIYDCTIK